MLWQARTVPPFSREASIHELANRAFDLLVIGGGMTGTGIAVDAAARGLSVALIERDDFASGTSSKSSKMVHGGLRYLQQNEFGLVYENLHERQRLLRNAPHLVSPLPFLIPLFGKDGMVSKTVARAYKTALWLYDITGGWRIGKRHRNVDRADVNEPAITCYGVEEMARLDADVRAAEAAAVGGGAGAGGGGGGGAGVV